MSVPSMMIEPRSGLSSPMSVLRNTDLPVPDGPSITQISPAGTVRVTSPQISCLPNDFVSPSTLISTPTRPPPSRPRRPRNVSPQRATARWGLRPRVTGRPPAREGSALVGHVQRRVEDRQPARASSSLMLQRRHDVDAVEVGERQQPALPCRPRPASFIAGLVPPYGASGSRVVAVGDQLERPERTDPADLADARVPAGDLRAGRARRPRGRAGRRSRRSPRRAWCSMVATAAAQASGWPE